jgi:hypothetical protein
MAVATPIVRKHPIHIPLVNSDLVAIIDFDDYALVKDQSWWILGKGQKWAYACTKLNNSNVLMHRLILD